jgi:BCD family chlorophyll transporter-like MFS transporter
MSVAGQLAALGWLGIVRLGLVQTSIGAVVVLTTSTINRVMVVELALPAMIPGFLVAVHHLVQMSRPHFGHRSDIGRRRTPWIIGGVLVLALGGAGAALGTALYEYSPGLGLGLALASFVAIGLGVGAAATSLLTLLAQRVDPERRAAAASIVWIMMIAGFAVTAALAGHFLDPFSPTRLVAVTATVSVIAVCLTLLALRGMEGTTSTTRQAAVAEASPPRQGGGGEFRRALTEVWREGPARRFTLFVFVSMLAYSAQDLILEPYAGTVFGMTPGQSTQLAGVQHGGVLLGMLLVAVSGTGRRRSGLTALRRWTIGGCVASGLALLGVAAGGLLSADWPLRLNVFLLGVANGAFAVAAIASMMALASHGRHGRDGLRMGLWGGAQAIAFGLGGFAGTVAIDIARQLLASPAQAYALVFAAEGLLFFYAAGLGAAVRPAGDGQTGNDMAPTPGFGDVAAMEILQGR